MCANKPIRNTKFIERHIEFPILVAARSKVWVCCLSLVRIVCSNPAWGLGCLFVVNIVCCQVEVFASGSLLVQRNPTEYGASECNREAA
jgi:hypothetical protein